MKCCWRCTSGRLLYHCENQGLVRVAVIAKPDYMNAEYLRTVDGIDMWQRAWESDICESQQRDNQEFNACVSQQEPEARKHWSLYSYGYG
jgi:hypothetical protein